MSCKNQGIIAKVSDRSTPEIVRGADAFVVTAVTFKGSNDPYPFDSFVGASALFPREDGDALVIVGELESSDRGEVRFDLPASGTELLAPGDLIDFEQRLEDARGLTILILSGAIGVRDSLF